jgi:hypothetical protein
MGELILSMDKGEGACVCDREDVRVSIAAQIVTPSRQSLPTPLLTRFFWFLRGRWLLLYCWTSFSRWKAGFGHVASDE